MAIITHGATSEWTDTGTILHTSETGESIVIGGTTEANSDIILESTGAAVFNQGGYGIDFRVESNTDANCLLVDGSNDKVGIGVNPPQEKLDVNGTVKATTFSGSGASLTALPSAQLTGALPAISGASLTALTSSTLSGALPAIDGSNLTGMGAHFDPDGAVVFNETGADVDFRVEGDGDTNLFYVNAGLDQIGIGQNVPTEKLHVQGTMRSNAVITGDNGEVILHTNGTAEFNRNSDDINFQVQGNNDTHLLWIDGGTDKVGIGVAAPAEKLDVNGTVKATAAVIGAAVIGTSADISLNADGSAVFNEQGEDVDFRIEGDGDPNLLYVNAGLDQIGIGTTTPSDKLQVQGTIRGNALVGGDDVDFIVHTNGSVQSNLRGEAVDFQVQGDTDEFLLLIDGSADRVGVGVEAPAEKLDVAGTIKSTSLLVVSGTNNVLQMNDAGIIGVNVETETTTADRWNNGGGRFVIRASGPNSVTTTLPETSGTDQTGCALRLETSYIPHANVMDFGLNSNAPHQGWIQMCNRASLGYNFFLALNPNGGNISINRPDNSYPLHVGNGTGNGNGAYCTNGGVWTDTSNRESKDNIVPLSDADATAAVMALEPQTYNYKDTTETHVGFIAEDVPDLVASEDRKGLSPMDIVAALTKVVQRQEAQIQQLLQRTP